MRCWRGASRGDRREEEGPRGVKVLAGGGEEEGWGEKERGLRLFILQGDNNDLILSPPKRGLALQVTDGKC